MTVLNRLRPAAAAVLWSAAAVCLGRAPAGTQALCHRDAPVLVLTMCG